MFACPVAHGVCVDLAHVWPGVRLSHAAQDQRPGVEVVVDHRQPVEVGDDHVVDGQDRLGVGLDPRHLGMRDGGG